jgi:hypothetical protein
MLVWLWLAVAGAVEPGDAVTVEAPVASRRFAGEPTAGPELTAGTEATVIAVVGDEVRLALGAGRFGWVPADAVRAEPTAE